MPKKENKTQPTKTPISAYVNSLEPLDKRNEIKVILKIMSLVTKEKPVLWGSAIVGFGTYHYKYESGREGDFMKSGFSARKTAITLYIMAGMNKFPELMSKLGKYKTGKSCLYIKKLKDIDIDVLTELIKSSHDYMTKKYG